MYNRRHVLIGGVSAMSSTMIHIRANSINDTTYQAFHSKLPDRPWLRLYAGIKDADTGVTQCRIEGDWPTGLAGSLYRNGPGRMERDGRRYQHWFDGDGLVQKWRIDGAGGVTHRGRLVQTGKYLYDESKNQLSRVGFGTLSDDTLGSIGRDAANVGNISVLPRSDELWALWEGGSAWRMDVDSLATEGMLKLSNESAGLPFSAHPRVEPDGTLWNFGYVSHMSSLVIWRLDAGAQEPKIWLVPHSPMTIPHDFIVTSKHLVLPLPPLHYEPNPNVTQSFLDAHVWHPDRSMEILVMNKDDPNDHFVIELPAQWIFHYSNAWEDQTGVIRFEGVSYDGPGLMTDTFKAIMRGDEPTSTNPSRLVQFRIDTRKRVAASSTLSGDIFACEFPAVDRRRTAHRHEWVTMLALDDQTPINVKYGLLNGVIRINTTTGASSHYRYPDHEVPEEHLFIPKTDTDSETDGWLLGTSLDYVSEETHLNVFELVDSTPRHIARATLPRLMPMGFHGQFVSAV